MYFLLINETLELDNTTSRSQRLHKAVVLPVYLVTSHPVELTSSGRTHKPGRTQHTPPPPPLIHSEDEMKESLLLLLNPQPAPVAPSAVALGGVQLCHCVNGTVWHS